MAYNNRNLLERIVEIQNITLEHTNRGATQRWVFENVFKNAPYRLSLDTFYKYMARNAKSELRELVGSR